MIVYPDGRIEGSPEEISAYMRLKDPMFGKMNVPLDLCNWPPNVPTHAQGYADYPYMPVGPFPNDANTATK